jgi:hypothetical protein
LLRVGLYRPFLSPSDRRGPRWTLPLCLSWGFEDAECSETQMCLYISNIHHTQI